MMGEFMERLRSALDGCPLEGPDGRRKWEAAREVSGGTFSATVTAARLEGPRRSHSTFEGYDYGPD